MLRVFKPRSPMNLGAWTLTAYSGAAAAGLREWLRGERTDAERSFHMARFGVVFSEVLQWLPLPPRMRRWASVASSLVELASGVALRWSMVHAGRTSVTDPEAARQSSRRSDFPD